MAPQHRAEEHAMRCAVFTAKGQALTIEDRPDPQPGPGQVVVRIEAAALNHRDLFITQGLYPGVTPPVVLGSDGCGHVAALGVGVTDWAEGDAVIINPGIAWGDDERAQQAAFRILGSPDDGTCATHVLVDAGQLAPKPTHLSAAEAAALPLAGLTAWRALMTRGGATPGERVLVTGAGGGVSTLVLGFATAHGCEVVVTSGSAAKIERAKQMGAAAGYDYHDEDWGRQLKKDGGVDLVVDGTAGATFNHAIDAMNPGGRLVCYGGTAGLPQDLNVRALFWKQLDLRGSTMGSPADFAAMVAFVERHGITPAVDSTRPLAEIDSALAAMDSASQFGKLVLDCS